MFLFLQRNLMNSVSVSPVCFMISFAVLRLRSPLCMGTVVTFPVDLFPRTRWLPTCHNSSKPAFFSACTISFGFSIRRRIAQRRTMPVTTVMTSGLSSSFGMSLPKSRRPRRYASTASCAFSFASSTVSPCVTQPGRAGTRTTYPPSSAGSITTVNARPVLDAFLDTDTV